ncbi:Alpha/Beta hydrolase protein, partial [Jimgerdemannia flammicorona]
LSLKTLEEAGNPIHHPTHVQDTAAAVAFLSQHAEQYNYRSDRIYLCGHSSAAHIVSLLALAPEHLIHEAAAATQGSPDLLSHIRGIICVEGIYDIPRLLTTWPDYRDFIEQAFGSDPTCYEVSSPQYHRPPNVGSVPPFLIVHSLEDELVDLPQSQEFFNHLVAIGVQSVDLDTSLQGTHFEMLHTQEFAETVAKFMRNLEA